MATLLEIGAKENIKVEIKYPHTSITFVVSGHMALRDINFLNRQDLVQIVLHGGLKEAVEYEIRKTLGSTKRSSARASAMDFLEMWKWKNAFEGVDLYLEFARIDEHKIELV